MRFEVVYDEGDWIFDNETGAYMDVEEACQKLNDLDESMGCVASFFGDVVKGVNKAGTEE